MRLRLAAPRHATAPGQASRSLLAAARLLEATGAATAGSVAHLRGGLAAWFAAGLGGEASAPRPQPVAPNS